MCDIIFNQTGPCVENRRQNFTRYLSFDPGVHLRACFLFGFCMHFFFFFSFFYLCNLSIPPICSSLSFILLNTHALTCLSDLFLMGSENQYSCQGYVGKAHKRVGRSLDTVCCVCVCVCVCMCVHVHVHVHVYVCGCV